LAGRRRFVFRQPSGVISGGRRSGIADMPAKFPPAGMILENSVEKPLILAHQGRGTEPRPKPVHLIGERKFPHDDPAIVCISADFAKISG
jgi:hypothetical protein